jgi:hypothetical protein
LDHKAFLFDFRRFEAELLPILENALATGDCDELIAFVRENVASLADPYEGQPLAADWEAMIVAPDPHQCGDFALTKFYDPTDDIRLGPSWAEVQEQIASSGGFTWSPILGRSVGPAENPFDPGKLGS